LRTYLQVLSKEECAQVHERTLEVLETTGVRVETIKGRQVLQEVGAIVDDNSHQVYFPRTLVEESLRNAPKKFHLGSRRPGCSLSMNEDECVLCADGGAIFVYDAEKKIRRLAKHEDWVKATRLIDAIDEIGMYWWMARENNPNSTMGDFVAYWRELFMNTSKHVQDVTDNPVQSKWLLEILRVVFGDQKVVRESHPISLLVCPVSPLVIEGLYADAYLETAGWNIPVAIMPMPLMGTTAPGSLISTVVLGNCEVLATLCLIQAAAPGTPFIYAPALAVSDPRSGRYGGGAVEHALLGASATEMARFYGFAVEASVGGTDHHVPCIQAGYERAINWVLPTLSWPDILVGPGLLSGSTILSFEQLLIDVEIFRRCKRLVRGIESKENMWLDQIIDKIGSGGNFLAQRSTRDALRSGEWYIDTIGVHSTYEQWETMGQPDLLVEVRQKIDEILESDQPMTLDEDQVRELVKIEKFARTEIS
jgi:trimethylamine--corrinoid protein Co-methyltransferase